MREAEAVPHLVRGELADALERQLHRVVGGAAARLLGAQQPLEDEDVLAHAQGVEGDVSLDHLAGARIDHAVAVGPAAGTAMHPLDHVVAHVERVRVRRQQRDAVAAREAGLGERVGPPAGAIEERAADRLGRSMVDVEDDRLHDRRLGAAGLGVLETMAGDPARLQRPVERRRVVVEEDGEAAAARIEGARPVAGVGQADERVVLHHRHRLRLRHRGAHLGARLAAAEGEDRLELEVVGERQAVVGVERAALVVELEAPLPRLLDGARDAVRVADDERREVDERAAVGLDRDNVGAPQHRGGERLGDGAALRGVFRQRAEALVRCLDQHARAEAADAHDAGGTELSAIQADRVAAYTGEQRFEVEVFADEALGAGRRQLEPQLALVAVEVGGEEAGPGLQALHLVGDFRRALGARGRRRLLGLALPRFERQRRDEKRDGQRAGEERGAGERSRHRSSPEVGTSRDAPSARAAA